MMKFGVSQPVTRKEDQRLLTGLGRYVDDIAPKDALHAFFLRSPMAHAEIASLDASAAREAPGVAAVITGEELAAEIPNFVAAGAVKNRDGSDGAQPERPILAVGKVRHVGEAVAVVLAETLAQARDAAELIEVDYNDLPAAHSTRGARQEPEVHPEIAPGNLAFDWAFGDEAATKAAFESAAHVVELPLVNNRVIAMPMEPRGAYAEWDGRKLHVATNGQGVWNLKRELGQKLGLGQGPGAGHQPRRGRRLRHEGLLLPRALRRRFRREKAGPGGALDVRARRGHDDRRHGPGP